MLVAEVAVEIRVLKRIAKIRGIGPKTATAMIAAIGDGSGFKNGRHLAAWLGLVPRQHSSGDRSMYFYGQSAPETKIRHSHFN